MSMERLTEKKLAKSNAELQKCKEKQCDADCAMCELNDEALLKLKAYEDAEEQGLLIRLPVAVGQVVYEICNDCTCKEGFCPEDTDDDSCYGCQYHAWKVSPIHYMTQKSIINRMHEFGRTIFLTMEEAEAALAEMEG